MYSKISDIPKKIPIIIIKIKLNVRDKNLKLDTKFNIVKTETANERNKEAFLKIFVKRIVSSNKALRAYVNVL